MDTKDLREAAKAMLVGNMNLKPGEKVLFVTDVPRLEDWSGPYSKLESLLHRASFTRQICDQAREAFPECQVDFLVFPSTGQNGTEPPAEVGEALLKVDVAMIMTTYSMTHTDARETAAKRGVRIASMPEIEESMFLPGGPMRADYQQVFRESGSWAEKMTACSQVHVLTPQGTDLTFSLEGRKGGSDHGLFHKPTEWGNLPAGEAYIAPVEGTANGTLVVPAGWYKDLQEDMTLQFKDGYVVSLTGGGQVGDHFRELFRIGEEEFRHRRNCAELGIGTNPNASRADNVLEAEKIRGTIHIAVGDSAHMDGTNPSDVHEDFILPTPELYFDGKKVI